MGEIEELRKKLKEIQEKKKSEKWRQRYKEHKEE